MENKEFNPGVYWDTQYNNRVTVFKDPESGDLLKAFYNENKMICYKELKLTEATQYLKHIVDYEKEQKLKMFKEVGRVLRRKSDKTLVFVVGFLPGKLNHYKFNRFEAYLILTGSKMAYKVDPDAWEDVTDKILELLND